MIKLEMKHAYAGPSPCACESAIVATLDISKITPEQALQLTTPMKKIFSNWFTSSLQVGSSPRLYIARFLAEWCLAVLNHERGFLHEAGARRKGDLIELWLGFHHPGVAYECLVLAVKFLIDIPAGKLTHDQIGKALNQLWIKCKTFHPDYQARILMIAARHAGIPYMQYTNGSKLWQFGWCENSVVFHESRSSKEPRFGSEMAGDKAMSKKVMAMLGVPIAKHVLVKSEDELADASSKIGWPCVVKPLDAHMAKGVTTDIRTLEELTTAYISAKKVTSGSIMVEAHVPGDVHRLLVVRGKLLVAVRRECPFVTGDGDSTIGELVQQLNLQHKRSGKPSGQPRTVPEDDEYLVTLRKQGLAPDSIAVAGRRVPLRRIPFQFLGGINTNVTKLVHPDVKVIAETLAVSLGIQIAGLDYVTEDISKSFQESGAVVEINLNPALPPMVDEALDERTLGQMVLGNEPGRIPIDLLLARPESVPDFSNMLPCSEKTGWVCGGQLGVGRTKLDSQHKYLAMAVRNLLKNKTINAVLIVATIDEIQKGGMPVDRVNRVILHDQAIDEEWMNVLIENSETCVTISSPADLANLLVST